MLDYYYLMKRNTKQSRWKISDNYSGLDRHSSDLTLDDVPLPDDVKEEAYKQFMATLRVGTWNEYGR